MNIKQVLTILGVVLIIVGTFMPIIQIPEGTLNMFKFAKNGFISVGIITLALGLISAIGVFANLYFLLWFTGPICLALAGFSFYTLDSVIKKPEADMSGNPLAVFLKNFMVNVKNFPVEVQIQWTAWVVLFLGSIFLILAAIISKDALADEEAPEYVHGENEL